MTLSRSNPRARPRWALLGLLVLALTAALASSMLAALPNPTLFELDKDGTANNKSDAVGYVASNINATQGTINVCQVLTYGTAPNQVTYAAPVAGEILLLRSEKMTFLSAAPGNFGGNCAGTKLVYSVTRGAPASSHSGGNNVSAAISVLRAGTDATMPGPDWSQVRALALNNNAETCSSLGLVECAFIADGIGPSTYTGGNTKDHIDIPSWQHTSGASPDKGEILNAYAAKAVVPAGNTGASAGEQILYFGMDRYAVDGSTDIGFWFFKNPVYACPDTSSQAAIDACANVPNGSFAGTHVGTLESPGDILILGTFTQGGATSNIRVFQWVGTGGNATNTGTVQGPNGTFGDCVPGSASANGCATVNNTSIEVWPSYTFKGDSLAGWAPAGGFFEGGVNLSALGLQGCFSSFLAETRSSPELTAVLKDFALGSFEACDATLTTAPGNGASTGNTALTDSDSDQIPDISIGSGSVEVRDRASLSITGIASWSGTLDFWLCKVDAPGLCNGTPPSTGNVGTKIGGSINVNQGTQQPILSDAATVTSAGRYCWRGVFTSGTPGVPNSTDSRINECFEVLPVTPQLSTNATAAIELGPSSSITDTATLAGTSNKPGSPVINPTGARAAAAGTITFRLYGPNDATCSNDPVYTSGAITVAGDGTYGGTTGGVTYTPTAAGTYYWVASYSGDPPNTNARSGACGDTNETSVVVDASITLSPLDATNDLGAEGGDLHDITATVQQDTGAGFVDAPDGTTVTFSLLNNDGVAEFLLDANDDPITTCTTTDGECTITIKGLQPGSVDVHATTTFDIGTIPVTRSTDGTAPNSGDANKIFVDASIAISPLEDENNVESEHVFTITVTIYPDGAELAVDDPTITPILTSDGDDVADSYVSTCDQPVQDATDSDVYTCTVTINNNSAEIFTLNASMSATIEGLAVSRSTAAGENAGPDGSGPATKEFVDGSLAWIKHDQDRNLLAGATFEVCQTEYLDTSGETDVLVAVEPPDCVSVVDDDGSDVDYAGLDEDPEGGQFLLTNLSLGTWTIRETAAPEGYAFDDELTQTVYLTLEDTTGSAATAFVNTRLFKLIVITCNESTSELVISTVDLDGNVLDTFGAVPASWGEVSEADICDLTGADGAVFGGLDAGIYEPTVTIPKPPPPAI